MRITYIFLFCVFSFSAFAQQQTPSRTDLEKRRQSILETIKETQEQLEETKNNKNATLAQLRALQTKLNERQKLIGNINEEIDAINRNIQHSSKEITDLRQNLEMLKVRYAQSIRYAYKTRSSYDMIAFIFSSNDFNEAIRRLKYLKKYRDYRKEQAEQIRLTQGKIQRKIGDLNTVKSQKDELRVAQEQQKQEVQKEAVETNKVVKELKGREKELSKSIERNRRAAKQVDIAIQKTIQREIELARKKAEEERRKEEERKRQEEEQRLAASRASNGMNVNTGSGVRSTNPNAGNRTVSNNTAAKTETASTSKPSSPGYSTSYINTLTPDVTALSNSFEANKGRLPWPVEKGFISLGFGKYQSPIEEKVTLENNGIDITTNPGATARAIFEGYVSKSFYVPGRNWSIIIISGAYFTVYSGIADVAVKAGQKVNTKQPIGKVGQNDEGTTVLYLGIWKVGKKNQLDKLDPAEWIAR